MKQPQVLKKSAQSRRIIGRRIGCCLGATLGHCSTKKPAQVFPMAFAIGGCALMLFYLMGLVFLLPFSLRICPRHFPAFGFLWHGWPFILKGNLRSSPFWGCFSRASLLNSSGLA